MQISVMPVLKWIGLLIAVFVVAVGAVALLCVVVAVLPAKVVLWWVRKVEPSLRRARLLPLIPRASTLRREVKWVERFDPPPIQDGYYWGSTSVSCYFLCDAPGRFKGSRWTEERVRAYIRIAHKVVNEPMAFPFSLGPGLLDDRTLVEDRWRAIVSDELTQLQVGL